MSTPSILFINRVYPPHKGASGRVLRDLAQACAAQGWSVSILTTGDLKSERRDNGITIHTIPSLPKPRSLKGFIGTWRNLYKTALKLPAHNMVITLTDPPLTAIIGEKIAKKTGAYHLHWSHDVYPDLLPALKLPVPAFIISFLRRLHIRHLERSDGAIVIGRDMKEYFIRAGLPEHMITYIPNWSDPGLPHITGKTKFNTHSREYSPSNKTIKPFQTLIKSDPKFRILYAGNIGRAHPVRMILKAAKILNQTQPDIEFIFVGQGARFDFIAKERAARHLDNIRIMPYQPRNRFRDLMESGDLHLVSMSAEAAGLLTPCKFYTALAVKRPCLFIGPKDNEIAQTISEFNAGAIVEPKNIDQLVETITLYRQDSDAWFSAYNGAIEASKTLTPDQSLQAWIQVIQNTAPDKFKIKRKTASS